MTGRNSPYHFYQQGTQNFLLFNLLKQKFRKTDVDSLDDFATVVEKSASINKS